MLQSNLFPEMVRPYDVSVTYCMRDVVDFLALLNLLQGYEGLLEQSEKYHSFLNNMPAFRLSRSHVKSRIKLDADGRKMRDEEGKYVYEESTKVQESRNHYKFGRAWLVDQYFYTQDYCVVKETRKKTRESSAHIIPESRYPHFVGNVMCDHHRDSVDEDMEVDSENENENEICTTNASCYCGSKQTCTECNFCSREMVQKIYKLAQDSLALVGLPFQERRRKGSLQIYNEWKKLRIRQYIRGLKVAYIIE